MQNNSLSKNLHTNLQVIKDLFKNDSTLKIRIFQNESLGYIEGCIIHIDGMVDNKFVSENVISPSQITVVLIYLKYLKIKLLLQMN